ncbi:MAG: DUF1015 domain-containing protein [Myxococcales bacterium]|nr:DUF1015 domain-containing protein [Myxococcales bacterium]
MVTIRPFRALHPTRELASAVASPPYDVVSTAEARVIAESNPHCFLRVGRAELELPDDVDAYSDQVYRHGAENLQKFMRDGVLVREPEPVLGVYQLQMGENVQTGLVCLSSVDDYDTGIVKKHELTRPAKEDDRTRLIEAHNSQSGPVFLTFRNSDRIRNWFEAATGPEPWASFTAADGIRHTLWIVRDPVQIEEAVSAFGDLPATYIADGHHRSAAASRVCAARRERGSDGDSHEGFLSVAFPDDELRILAYNRVVRDLAGQSSDRFLAVLSESFELAPTQEPSSPPPGGFALFLDGVWRSATPKVEISNDPVKRLSVSILEDRVLKPVLGIVDQRTDDRIDFVGGIRGVAELERLVSDGQWAAAFFMHPTTVADLLAVADAGQIMPPKSTWFEPKLRDGLFVHVLD